MIRSRRRQRRRSTRSRLPKISRGRVLRLRVIGGGCAGFSYDLYFEDKPTDLDEAFEDQGHQAVHRPAELPVPRRHRDRLRRRPAWLRLQVRQSERDEHLRLRLVVLANARLLGSLDA